MSSGRLRGRGDRTPPKTLNQNKQTRFAAVHNVLQVSCVSEMRTLDPTATAVVSGADLLRYARARKCNAAAAIQVSTCSLCTRHLCFKRVS
jgi:hypothetical protein